MTEHVEPEVTMPVVKLTDVTWEAIGHTLSDRTRWPEGRPWLSWEAQVDLGKQLAEGTTLTEKQARTLVDAAAKGNLPVVLTWDTWLRDIGATERTTTTVTVESITFWPGSDQPARIRIRYWGFGHHVYAAEILEAKTPETTREFYF